MTGRVVAGGTWSAVRSADGTGIGVLSFGQGPGLVLVPLASDGTGYAAIGSPTMLLGGSRSPQFLTTVLHELARIIPGARTEVLPGLGHNAPDENAPARVAQLLRRHLTAGQ